MNNDDIRQMMLELIPKAKRYKFNRLWRILENEEKIVYLTTEEEYMQDLQEFWSALEDCSASVVGVLSQDIYKQTRKQEVVLTRHIVFWYLRNCTELSLTSIGSRYEKDHATVMHGVSRVNNQLEVDDLFYTTIFRIAELMKEKGFEKPLKFISIFEMYLIKIKSKINKRKIKL